MRLEVVWICSCRKELHTTEVKQQHLKIGHTIVAKKIARKKPPFLMEGVTEEEFRSL